MRNGLVGVVYRFNALRSWGMSAVSALVQYRYFALGSVLTLVSTLNEREPEESQTIVRDGCGLVTFGPADRMNIIR